MVIDSSALVAIVLGESEAEACLKVMETTAEPLLISPITLVESTIVVEARSGPDAVRDLELLIGEYGIQVSPCAPSDTAAAIEGWRRFGKGRHPAGLNLGDVFPYGLAVSRGDALLFKGEDFARTDVRRALLS
ncbi:type II toxin-antitoxin system VapC family toxin [Knoellia subterranea]|uniref:Ribonuclease VapC n=1 Tax=Knoellia subterranea KCTC 19937 TaxID=1385521 RepID=A0A0A0JND3_9MICO|nr:type II toxin-antitoxin system VapC family toxin [Knoellia subterranea]KGN37131.1 ribonuclease [Knoellia subterranea KCTC 19937]